MEDLLAIQRGDEVDQHRRRRVELHIRKAEFALNPIDQIRVRMVRRRIDEVAGRTTNGNVGVLRDSELQAIGQAREVGLIKGLGDPVKIEERRASTGHSP